MTRAGHYLVPSPPRTFCILYHLSIHYTTHAMPQPTIAEDLQAFAPSGANVRKILEVAEGTFGITDLFLEEGGPHGRGLQFEYTHGAMGDSDGVSHEGELFYVREDGKVWPESALTLKDEDDEVVREGQPCEPLEMPHLSRMVGEHLWAQLQAQRQRSTDSPDGAHLAAERPRG